MSMYPLTRVDTRCIESGQKPHSIVSGVRAVPSIQDLSLTYVRGRYITAAAFLRDIFEPIDQYSRLYLQRLVQLDQPVVMGVIEPYPS